MAMPSPWRSKICQASLQITWLPFQSLIQMNTRKICIRNEFNYYPPYANIWYPSSKRPLACVTQFKGITTNFDEVVDQSTESSQWKCRREQCYITKLDTLFKELCINVIILQCKDIMNNSSETKYIYRFLGFSIKCICNGAQ